MKLINNLAVGFISMIGASALLATPPVIPPEVAIEEKGELKLKHIKHPVKPLLWKVEHEKMEKTSYLFGTVHVADKEGH